MVYIYIYIFVALSLSLLWIFLFFTRFEFHVAIPLRCLAQASNKSHPLAGAAPCTAANDGRRDSAAVAGGGAGGAGDPRCQGPLRSDGRLARCHGGGAEAVIPQGIGALDLSMFG